MKTMIKVLVAGLCTVMFTGFIYSQYVPETNVQTRWFVETVHKGDCFNDIIGNYYDNSIRANKSWDEWQTQQKQYNQQLFANGRALQPGDKILIVTKVRVAK